MEKYVGIYIKLHFNDTGYQEIKVIWTYSKLNLKNTTLWIKGSAKPMPHHRTKYKISLGNINKMYGDEYTFIFFYLLVIVMLRKVIY